MTRELTEGQISALCTPHTLPDGRLFYADQQVFDWPLELRRWIAGDNNYWRYDVYRYGYVSPMPENSA